MPKSLCAAQLFAFCRKSVPSMQGSDRKGSVAKPLTCQCKLTKHRVRIMSVVHGSKSASLPACSCWVMSCELEDSL